MALELVFNIIQDDNEIREKILEIQLVEELVKLGRYSQSEDNQVKVIQIISNILTTSDQSQLKVLIAQDSTIEV